MTYTLESDIPLTGRATPSKSRYPFSAMQPGMSFLVPYTEGPNNVAVQRRVIVAVSRANAARWNQNGRQWTARDVGDGMRVWRVR